MKIYKDVITGDEMVSDSFPMTLVDNVVYEVECAMITVGGDKIDIGANASAEEAAEALEDGVERVNNVIYSFSLKETEFDKKSYMTTLKSYMKVIKKHLADKGAPAEEIKEFEEGATKVAKRITASFKDFQFLTGESMNPDGMVALMNYREDGITPYILVWKHGLEVMKV